MNDTEMTERLRKIFSEIKEQAGDSTDWLTQYDAIRFAADRIEALNRRLLAEENHVEILNIENGHLQADRNNLELRVKELDNKLADCKASSLHGQSAMAEEINALCETLRVVNDKMDELRQERDEARRLLKAVVDMMRDNMAHDATHPHHLCDFIHRPDIGMCKVCEDWTDAMVMCYPDDFQDEEDGK